VNRSIELSPKNDTTLAATIANKLFGLRHFQFNIPCFVLFTPHTLNQYGKFMAKWLLLSLLMLYIAFATAYNNMYVLFLFLQAAYTEDQLAGECVCVRVCVSGCWFGRRNRRRSSKCQLKAWQKEKEKNRKKTAAYKANISICVYVDKHLHVLFVCAVSVSNVLAAVCVRVCVLCVTHLHMRRMNH